MVVDRWSATTIITVNPNEFGNPLMKSMDPSSHIWTGIGKVIALLHSVWISVVDCGSSMEVADKDDSNGAMVSLKVHDR